MLNSTEILANALGERLSDIYMCAFNRREPRYAEGIAEAAKLVLERIGLSDALYHTAEHTALVTLVGQDLLRGERLRRNVTAEDWLQLHARHAHARHRLYPWHLQRRSPRGVRR
jgi:hypothetical protein